MIRGVSDVSGSADWFSPGAPGEADAMFASFMERVDQLAIEGFDEPVSVFELERLVRVDYVGEGGEALGFLELLRGPSTGSYYLVSERTRVAARAISLLAERVEQDLPNIF